MSQLGSRYRSGTLHQDRHLGILAPFCVLALALRASPKLYVLHSFINLNIVLAERRIGHDISRQRYVAVSSDESSAETWLSKYFTLTFASFPQ